MKFTMAWKLSCRRVIYYIIMRTIMPYHVNSGKFVYHPALMRLNMIDLRIAQRYIHTQTARWWALFTCICGISGCTPQFITPDASPKTGVIKAAIQTTRFISFDGASLPLRRWLPPAKPEAIIVALHGFNDYSRFINDAATFFSRQGIAVYAYDQRGFGNAPHHGRWPGKDALAADARLFVQRLHARFPDTPLFLLGHSMGAAVALYALAAGPLPVNGVILAAPAIWGWSSMPWWQRWGLKLAAHTMPWKTFTGESQHIVASDNRQMLIALSRDPLIIKQTRVDTIYGLVNLMEAGFRSVAKLHTPTLALYGDKDEVIPAAPIMNTFGALAGHSDWLQFRRYKNGYHMLLRDLQAKTVWRDILIWVRHRPPS